MRAILNGQVVTKTRDIKVGAGCEYFTALSARPELLQKARMTDVDLACPHNVQSYDGMIEGVRHDGAAWPYEAPRPSLLQVTDRSNFVMWSRSLASHAHSRNRP
jgi:uncharacterized protein (DUF427 family)